MNKNCGKLTVNWTKSRLSPVNAKEMRILQVSV